MTLTIIISCLFAAITLTVIIDSIIQFRRQRVRVKRALEHDRCCLAFNRIYYIGRLRYALVQCRKYIDYEGGGTEDAAKLVELIDSLTTAVNINGEKLERKT